jgi:acetyl esterase/lipase
MRPVSRRSFAIGACALAWPVPASAQAGLEKTTVSYRSIEGHMLLADIYRPKGYEPCPVIVWFHAGGLIMGSREWIIPQIRALAEEKKFCVVSFDYRLAPETKLPAIISDVDAAFQWLASDDAKRFHLDLGRTIVAGNSAGAYLALVSGYRVQPRPKALVSLYGYGRLNADWYTKPNLYPEYNSKKITVKEVADQTNGPVVSDDPKGAREPIYMYYRQTGLWLPEVSGFGAASIAAEISPYEPANNITRDYPPTLLIHGTEDHDVPYQESVDMAALLERQSVPHILRSIDKAGHLLAGGDKAQIDDAYRTMREFITSYLERSN